MAGPPTTEDCWGRARRALGTTFARAVSEDLRVESLALFERAAAQPPAGRADLLRRPRGGRGPLGPDPANTRALSLVEDAARLLDRPSVSAAWEWPEDRLTYANAVLPEATMTVGALRGDERLVELAACQLAWLGGAREP